MTMNVRHAHHFLLAVPAPLGVVLNLHNNDHECFAGTYSFRKEFEAEIRGSHPVEAGEHGDRVPKLER